MDFKINSKEENENRKKTIQERKILKNLNSFIEETRNKFNYVSESKKEIMEKKKLARSHYVGYDPEEDD